MRLVETRSGRQTKIETGPEARLVLQDAIQQAANRLAARIYGAGHYARRAVGWSGLRSRFDATICRAVGGMQEEVGRTEFEIQH